MLWFDFPQFTLIQTQYHEDTPNSVLFFSLKSLYISMSGNLVSYITVYISIYLMSISFRRCYAVAEFSAFTSALLSSSLRDHLFVVLGLFFWPAFLVEMFALKVLFLTGNSRSWFTPLIIKLGEILFGDCLRPSISLRLKRNLTNFPVFISLTNH